MKRLCLLPVALVLMGGLVFLFAKPPQDAHQIPLSTSKFLGETPGRIGALNSFPAIIAVSPDQHYAAFLNDGYGTQATQAHQSITILDLNDNQLADFPDPRLGDDAHQSYFLGLVFGSDGRHLYASIGSITDPLGLKPGDTGNGIAVYKFEKGKVSAESFIKVAPQRLPSGRKVAYALRQTPPGTAIPYPAGLALTAGPSGDRLLVANNFSDNVVLLDLSAGKILQRFDLSTNSLVPSSFPYTVVATRDGKRAWCSLWNASQVAELDLVQGRVTRWIPLLQPKEPTDPGSHPTALLLSPDEQNLYVALSNSDAVAVISTADGKLQQLLDTRFPGQQYAGTYPNALALSSDGKYLFVADAAINALAVFEFPSGGGTTQHRAALGFIPTDWYPSALGTVSNDLLVATAKGRGTGPNNGANKLKSSKAAEPHPYIVTLLYGSAARLNLEKLVPQLPQLTHEAEKNALLAADPGKIVFAHGSNPIRHVIYVLKENRTYDQILGDLKVGNGDSSLTMYGADITPNEHKLALQFGVLDNFYDSGEVSGDGHNWSTAAIATDYNEKTWQIDYRSKERAYDFQGTVNDEFPLDYDESDINDPTTGFIWDNLAGHGVSYRVYGEFVDAVWCKPEKMSLPGKGVLSPLESSCPQTQILKGEYLPSNVGQPHGSASPWPWPVPLIKAVKPTKAALRDHYDPKFPGFNTDYPDQLRADEFLNEFDAFVRARKDATGSQLPQFVLLYLPDDHTGGTRPGKPRPAASVADNDLALGRVVDAVSHSSYWDDTAIFVLEDDAQDGADHVDAHRSIAYVISKYSPGSSGRPFVDHHFYTTVSLVHTMESILGLPPMNQNDAYAPVMAPLFTGSGNQPPYKVDATNRENGMIYQVNPPRAPGAKQSEAMDFSRPDAVNADELNAILWRDRKGSVPMPFPRHLVFPDGVGD